MTDEKQILYGQHAYLVGVETPAAEQQWACRKCGKIYGVSGKHAASFCCCTSVMCACGAVIRRHDRCCQTCRERQASERWYAKPETIWNGEWPLGLMDADDVFNGADELIEHIYDTYLDGPWDEMRLTSCTPNKPRGFSVHDWCEGELSPEGMVPNFTSINNRINAILSEIGVLSWSQVGDRLNVRDVLKRIGFELGETAE